VSGQPMGLSSGPGTAYSLGPGWAVLVSG